MDNKIIELWDKNKDQLRKYFTTTSQNEYVDYLSIVKIIVVKILNAEEDNYNYKNITVVDDGDYQGTQIFIIPRDTYQPDIDEYLITHTYYGSCSGCDTLQDIMDWGDKLPSEEQIDDYMTLCLHLIQKMKPLCAN